MPDVAGPFDGPANTTGSWGQAQWYRDAVFRAPSGVYGPPGVNPPDGDLGVTFNGLNWSVATGRAHVRGMGYERTTSPTTGSTAANSSGNARVDRLVVRRDLGAKTGTVIRLQGTPAGTPVPPALQRSEDGQWDLPLFRFRVPPNNDTTITNIVDERVWIDPDGGDYWASMVQMRQGAEQGLASGGWYGINMSIEDYDTSNGHTGTSSIWYPRARGIYLVSGLVSYAGNPNGQRGARIARNGTVAIGGSATLVYAAGSMPVVVPTKPTLVGIEATDYIEVQGYHDVGAGQQLNTAVSGVGDQASSITAVFWRPLPPL